MTVTFFGHRDTPPTVCSILEKVLIDLIENEGAVRFFVGNQGAFDRMVRSALRGLTAVYPSIEYAVVLAYLPVAPTDTDDFSDTLFPDGFETVPRRFAIDRRNRWMLNESDAVVTYVTQPCGGAAKFKARALQKGKRVIELSEYNKKQTEG